MLRLREGPEAAESRLAQGLAWSLAALALALTAALTLRSEAEDRREGQRRAGLRLDSQTGLPSRQALEEDLGDPSLAALAPEVSSLLLAMVNLRLLQRQQAFLDADAVRQLFATAQQAVSGEQEVGSSSASTGLQSTGWRCCCSPRPETMGPC